MLCVVCIVLIVHALWGNYVVVISTPVKNLVLAVGGFELLYEGQADEMASQSIYSSMPTIALVTF